MMWYSDHGTTWAGWLLMSLGMVAFWGGVIWLVWYLITRVAPRADAPTSASSPERILDERFARGEIDTDEYRTRRDALHGAVGREPANTPTLTAANGRRKSRRR